MPEVHAVYATVRRPKDANDIGQVTEGFYTLVDDLLTMTNREGRPVQDFSNGETFKHQVKAAEDAVQIAKRLTLKIYRMMRSDGMAGFNRPLVDPTGGIA